MMLRPGLCTSCGKQVIIRNASSVPVRPTDQMREGYLVFDNPEERLKTLVCVGCEENPNLEQIMLNLRVSGLANHYMQRNPVRYEKYKDYWAAQGITVHGPWERV